jgi:hypothetical protein
MQMFLTFDVLKKNINYVETTLFYFIGSFKVKSQKVDWHRSTVLKVVVKSLYSTFLPY